MGRHRSQIHGVVQSKAGRPRTRADGLKFKRGRPKKITKAMMYSLKLRSRNARSGFKPEESTVIKPPVSDEVEPYEAILLVDDADYYQVVEKAGIDPMYAYRYLAWKLNCPHHPHQVKQLVDAHKPSPATVFNYLGDKLV